MKKLTTLCLFALVSTSAFAQDYTCRQSYANKMGGTILRAGAGGILTLGAGTGAVVGGAAAILTGATMGAAPILGVGILGAYTYYEGHRLEAYYKAAASIEEAHLPGGLEAAREQVIQAEKDRLQKKLNDKINPQRTRNGEAVLTLDQYLESNPLRVNRTPLEETVFQVNRGLSEDITYEQAVEIIKNKSGDDSFCENGNPMGIRKFKRFLRSEAENLDQEALSVDNSERSLVEEVESSNAPVESNDTTVSRQ